MDVDAVEEGSGDFVHIAQNLAGGTDAAVSGVAVITAWAGIHGGDEHEGGGVVDAVLGTTDGDMTVFKGLAKHLKDTTGELRQLIEEQNAIVSERDFAWLRIGAAADKGHLRDGVVGGAEGTLTDEAGVATELAGNGVYLCGLKALAERQWWED